DLHKAVDLVVSELMPGLASRQDAGVVDQDVHMAVTLLDAFDGFGDLSLVRHIADGRIRDAARGANLFANFRSVLDVENFYLRAFGGQTNRRRAAKPRRRYDLPSSSFLLPSLSMSAASLWRISFVEVFGPLREPRAASSAPEADERPPRSTPRRCR